MKGPCIICQIIKNETQSFVIYEDENFISFLDSHPLFIGHSLLAPKKHCQTIYDLSADQGKNLLLTIQKVGQGITNAMQAEGTFIAMNNIVSQSINHLHIHIVPRNKGDGLKGFFWPRTRYKDVMQMEEIKHAIKEKISHL